MKHDDLARHISTFLQTYLPLQRGFSKHTVLSYRDTIKLLLVYSAARKKKSVNKLLLDDLEVHMVTNFLDQL